MDHPGTKNLWESTSSTMSMLTVAILLKRQASRFLFFESGSLELLFIWRREFKKFNVSSTGTQCQPTSLPTVEYCSMDKSWKCSKQH